MEFLQLILDMFLHIDAYLAVWAQQYGVLVYGALFAVIFMETGLVVTPFLPGDSLLFAAGALAGAGAMNLAGIVAVIVVAAFLGDTLNHLIGRRFGAALLESGRVRMLKPEYVERTRDFFARHGGKAVTLARFFPIIRTFSPFMAGVGHMPWRRFWAASILGSLAWVATFVGAGFFFGNIPWVKENFEYAVMAIIALTIAPAAYHTLQSRLRRKKARATGSDRAQ